MTGTPGAPAAADVVVIGAGAVGASTARNLARRGLDVVVVEKEPGPAAHQSGRNSGVIHSGYNLKPGTMKATYCVEGSRQLRAYCEERDIAMDVNGILVVARREDEVPILEELKRRSDANKVAARIVDGDEVRDLEPHAAGVAALHAPEGASFDARAYVHALAGDAINAGATILYDTRVLHVADPTLTEAAEAHQRGSPLEPGDLPAHADTGEVVVSTTHGDIAARTVVNAAGLHADRLAGLLAKDVRVVPFRGYYAELRANRRSLVRSHVYAAPDLAFPFLGVHLSRRADGRVIVGPGAMLAFGREAYRFREVNGRDLASTLTWPGFYRLLGQKRFRGLIRSEMAKSLSLKAIWREARQLVPELRPGDLVRSYAGNRAQMVTRSGDLVMDILVRETGRAVHVLNAVSPGLTCSLPFGEYLAERAESKVTG